jgi:hypothetical protein
MSEDRIGPATPVPGYAGHADARARRLSDQQVRAWVGEILAGLRGRIALDGLAERFEALVLRCEFGDQHVIRAIEDDRFGEPELAEEIEAHDRALVEVANQGRSAEAASLGALVEALERAFDARAAAITGGLKR